MTDVQEPIAENWNGDETPRKQSKIARFINIHEIGKGKESTGTAKTGSGRKPKAYTLTTKTAEIVARKVFDTIGFATKAAEIWTLTDSEAKAIAESGTPVFNALPEKLRTVAGEQGTRAGLVLALFNFGNTMKQVMVPRIAATKMMAVRNSPEFVDMSDAEFGDFFSDLMRQQARTGTDG